MRITKTPHNCTIILDKMRDGNIKWSSMTRDRPVYGSVLKPFLSTMWYRIFMNDQTIRPSCWYHLFQCDYGHQSKRVEWLYCPRPPRLPHNCYRPISILPFLSKVFESQVNKQITNHLESHRNFSAMQSGFRAGHGCTSATLKVLKWYHNHHRLKTWPRLLTLSITTLSALVSQIGGPVARTSGSLFGGATGFNPQTDSFLCIHQWCHSCCWWFSDPPLRIWHNSVYFWTFFGYCVNKPPDELQCHTTLLPWPPTALKCVKLNACSSTDRCLHPLARLASLLWTVLT